MSPNILIILIIVLVPVIPAYLLFKLLPSRAIVTGPFKGLKIDLGGSFAGYFLIFIVLIDIRSSFQVTDYQEWTAKGRIVQADSNITFPYVDQRYVTFSSPAVKSDPNGNFSLTFLVTSDGRYDFPYMYISYPDCTQKSFFLGPKEKKDREASLPVMIDMKNRIIDIGDVQLVKSPASQNSQGSQPSNPYLAQVSR